MKEEDKYFIIPNPIYDVVFKYLMEDPDSAMIVLSTLLEKKIVKLDFVPQEYTHKLEEKNKKEENITIFHLDFAATIELSNGKHEIILIELQKAKEPNDIFRFKRYLAKNFQKKFTKQITNPKTKKTKEIEVSYPIFPIYIFNFKIETEIKDLIIKVNREKKGVFTEKKLETENDFIENITYDALIIQLPYISQIEESAYAGDEYKEKLYHLLELFNQSKQMKNHHRLMLIRKLFPGYLDRVIKRLQSADSIHPGLEEDMHIEDEYIKVLRDKTNETLFLKEKLGETEQKLEGSKQVIEENKQELEENKQELEENKQVIEGKDQELEGKDQKLQESAIMLKKAGISLEQIQKATGLSKEEIEKLPIPNE